MGLAVQGIAAITGLDEISRDFKIGISIRIVYTQVLSSIIADGNV
jgi:hypothetical protein